jgi:hypothetical protein
MIKGEQKNSNVFNYVSMEEERNYVSVSAKQA